jgi:flagellar basal body-associated protein FliL
MPLLLTLFGAPVLILGAICCSIELIRNNFRVSTLLILLLSLIGILASVVFAICFWHVVDAWNKSDDPQIDPLINWGAGIYRYTWWISFPVILYLIDFISKRRIKKKRQNTTEQGAAANPYPRRVTFSRPLFFSLTLTPEFNA